MHHALESSNEGDPTQSQAEPVGHMVASDHSQRSTQHSIPCDTVAAASGGVQIAPDVGGSPDLMVGQPQRMRITE